MSNYSLKMERFYKKVMITEIIKMMLLFMQKMLKILLLKLKELLMELIVTIQMEKKSSEDFIALSLLIANH